MANVPFGHLGNNIWFRSAGSGSVSWWHWVGAGCTVWWSICMKYYPGTRGGTGGGGGGEGGKDRGGSLEQVNKTGWCNRQQAHHQHSLIRCLFGKSLSWTAALKFGDLSRCFLFFMSFPLTDFYWFTYLSWEEPIEKHLERGGGRERNLEGDWTNFLFITGKVSQNRFVLHQWGQLVTAWGSLLVRGATLDMRHCPVASRGALRCLTKFLPKSIRHRKVFSAVSFCFLLIFSLRNVFPL